MIFRCKQCKKFSWLFGKFDLLANKNTVLKDLCFDCTLSKLKELVEEQKKHNNFHNRGATK